VGLIPDWIKPKTIIYKKDSMAEMEIKVVKSFYIWSSSGIKKNQLFN
jgi:hypothetical protein